MELRQYAAILWRWKWLVILGIVVAGVASYILSSLQTPIYEASTTLLIDEAPSTRVSDYTALLTSERLAQTYAQMITKRPVLEGTMARLGLEDSPNGLGSIDVQPVRDTQLITVSVEHPDPQMAARVANTLVEVFAEQNDTMQAGRFAASKESLSQELTDLQNLMQQTQADIDELGEPKTDAERSESARLETNLAQYRQSYTALLQSYEMLRISESQSVSNVIQVESATPPISPIRPRITMNTFLAAMVGGMIAIGAIFLIEYLDTSIKTPDEAVRELQMPMLGLIGHIEVDEARGPHVAQNPRSHIAEAFRKLRSNIEFAAVDRPIHSLLIASPGPTEGKSTVASNLAVSLSQDGRHVVLLDADLRRPRIHKMMATSNRIGLSDLLVRAPLSFDGIIRPWRKENLALITSGGLPPNPAELLGSERMNEILKRLSAEADIVIVDTPPMSVVTDAVLLAARVDAVLIIVEPQETNLGAAQRALEQLRLADANVIGFVMNNVPIKRGGYYNGYYSGYYYYYYAEAYGDDGSKKGMWRSRKKRQATKRHSILSRLRPSSRVDKEG